MTTQTNSQASSSKFRTLLRLMREAFLLFQHNDPLRLASSTAFFTVFALPPIFMLLISVLGMVFNNSLISGELFHKLSGLVGETVAGQVELILANFMDLQRGWLTAAFSFAFLTFVATTLFSIVQKSLNQLWNLRARVDGKVHVKEALQNRMRGLLLILSSGLLFLASIFTDAIFAFINDHYVVWDKDFQLQLMQVVNRVASLLVETAWFAIIFKFLPYAHVRWRAVWVGAFGTGLLFMLGKIILGRLLVTSDLSTLYAASGSVVVLLLFIFYSAMILYYGACFTRVYARSAGMHIVPKSFATFYQWQETKEPPFLG